MKVEKLSPLLKLLQWSVRSGRLKRGYGQLLEHIPDVFWGGKNILVETDIGEMLLSINDPGSIGLMLYGKILHEVQESVFIKNLSASCQVVFDIGANVGWYSCLMWNEMKNIKAIYAFEPNPHSYPYLVYNLSDKEGIVAENLAVGEASRTTTIYCSKSSNLSSTTRPVGQPVFTEQVSLDDYTQSRNIGIIDFIKCDVEGGELFVLRGAKRIRGEHSPPIWMIEVDNNFIMDIGFSQQDLIEEIISIDKTAKLFSINNHIIKEITSPVGNNIQPNVFIVPNARLRQFEQTAIKTKFELDYR